MSSTTNIKKMLSFLFWIGLFLAAILIPQLQQQKLIAIIAAGIPWAVKLAYEHFDGFNLLTNRIVLWLFNREVSWEMKAHFEGDYNQSDIKGVINAMKKTMPTMKIIQEGGSGATISFPILGVVINLSLARVRTEEDEFVTELVLAVQRLIVPFRHNTKILHSLTSLIEDVIRKTVEPKNEKYEFKAFFVTTNPYLGLFLRQLKVSNTPRINIEFRDKEGVNEGKVAVSSDKVSLVARDLSSFQALSRKYITLSSLNLSET
jgi:hypothetical protein